MPTPIWDEALTLFSDTLTRPKNDYSQDPITFATETLGLSLWAGQQEIIEAVLTNRFTVVEAGKGVGKSVDASALVCYWLTRYDPATVITLAPTWQQVNNILWRYIRQLSRKAKLPGNVFETARWEISEQRFAIGLSPKKHTAEDVATLQGYHSPNLLIVMDEAPGLPRMLWEAVMGLVVSENNKILAIGNPIEQQGPFFEATQSPQWRHIRISCLDHPNVIEHKEIVPGAVSWDWVDGAVRDHCTKAEGGYPGAFEWPPGSGQWWFPNAFFQSSVLGVPPTEGNDQLIPLAWVEAAKNTLVEGKADLVIGLDPAYASSGDHAAMVARTGNRVLWVKRKRPTSKDPTAEIAGWLVAEMREAGAIRGFVDNIGIGAGIADTARRTGAPVLSVDFRRTSSNPKRFKNLRSECWWQMAQSFRKGEIQLMADDLLEADLTAPKVWYDELGRTYLEPKEDIKARLGRSPDSGDALAITYALPSSGSLDAEQQASLREPTPGKWIPPGLTVIRRSGSRWRVRRRGR